MVADRELNPTRNLNGQTSSNLNQYDVKWQEQFVLLVRNKKGIGIPEIQCNYATKEVAFCYLGCKPSFERSHFG